MIKLFDPYFDSDEEKALTEVLRSRFWASGAGTGKVAKFEEEFKRYTDSSDCVAVNSGTAALHLALLQLGIEGREVLVPSLTFVSTVSMIRYCGGNPVFVDVNEDTLCIDVDDVKNKITPNTGAILPVHFGGMPCDLSRLSKVAEQHGFYIIEDAAHACGSKFGGKKIGSHNDLVCFSFHPVKNLAMPTGGAIALNGKQSADRKLVIKSQRWCGIDGRNGLFYDVPRLGLNYYMNEFSAAMGLTQLKKLDYMNEIRRKIALRYSNEITLQNKMPQSDDCVYHLYWIRVKNRIEFIKKMNDSDIEVGIHYIPVHQMTLFDSSLKLPVTDLVGNEIVSLPIHPNLTEKEVSFIIEKVNEFAQ